MDSHHLPVTRTARIVTLGSPAAPRETWIALHGYGQLAARFARRLVPLDDGTRFVVVPEGLSRHYGNHKDGTVGASWMTREDRETEIADYVRYLDAVAGWMPEAAAGAPRTLLGFSQGSATTWRWATHGTARPPERLITWGGELPPDLDLAAAAARLRHTAIVFVTGTDDPYCPPPIMAGYVTRLRDAGLDAATRTFAGGHEILPDVLTALAG